MRVRLDGFDFKRGLRGRVVRMPAPAPLQMTLSDTGCTSTLCAALSPTLSASPVLRIPRMSTSGARSALLVERASTWGTRIHRLRTFRRGWLKHTCEFVPAEVAATLDGEEGGKRGEDNRRMVVLADI